MSDPMKQYEVTFIVDPVLSGEEIKATAQTYVDLLEKEKCEIVHIDEMGLRQLAYPINKRTSGVYYCIEFKAPQGEVIYEVLELALRRDERIIRFLTVKLDKYGIQYNQDKREGKIGTIKKKKPKNQEGRKQRDSRSGGGRRQQDGDSRGQSRRQEKEKAPGSQAGEQKGEKTEKGEKAEKKDGEG